MKSTDKTKKAYEEHLNEMHIAEFESEEWIIGGKLRAFYRNSSLYGTALRKYDPIGFEVGYNDWKLNKR